MDAGQIIKDALDANPELRLVLEVSERTQLLESLAPPVDIRVATETIVIPVTSQSLVPTVPLG